MLITRSHSHPTANPPPPSPSKHIVKQQPVVDFPLVRVWNLHFIRLASVNVCARSPLLLLLLVLLSSPLATSPNSALLRRAICHLYVVTPVCWCARSARTNDDDDTDACMHIDNVHTEWFVGGARTRWYSNYPTSMITNDEVYS